jgi:TonB family protein
MTLMLQSAVIVSLLLLIALGATALLRRRSAALRHWLLATAIVCAFVVPAVAQFVPAWRVRMPIQDVSGATWPMRMAGPATSVSFRVVPAPTAPDRRQSGLSIVQVLFALWIAGTAASLSLLLFALARLRRIAARALAVTDPRWLAIAARVARDYGVARPIALLQSTQPTLLVTWGLRRPKVILPAVAPDWSDDRMHVVLAHEFAHIARGDWALQMLGELLRSIYWFNPLLWLACRRLRQESEHACDDAVLTRGIAGTDYATHLLDLARALRHHGPWLPAPAMASPSTLQRRIRVMLDTTHNRHALTRRARTLTAGAVVAVTLLLASFGASAQSFVSVSGSISDSQGAVLRDAPLVLSNIETKAKYEVRSSSTGEYEFLGVTPGRYLLETAVPGFKPVQQELALAGNVRRDISLQIGTLQETVTVTGGPAPVPSPDDIQKEIAFRDRARVGFEQKRAECRPATATAGPPVGGQIRPPRKIRDVRPQYPEALKAAGIGGTAKLVARIGTEGIVTEARSVDQSVAPELVNAAIDAVKQWEFDGTLLNCVPVDVEMTVSVGFDPRERP